MADWSPPPLKEPPAIVQKADPSLLAAFRAKTTQKVTIPGWHVHRCLNGHEWSHTEASFGKVADHTCPVCGLQDWTPRQLNTRIVEVTVGSPPQTYTLPQSNCPGGVCPVSPPAQKRGILGLFR